jgi:predicted nuclease with TOPRIM domain
VAVTDSEMTHAILREIRDGVHDVSTRIERLDERLTGRIDGLTGRVETLTGRVETLTGRVETIEHSLKDVGVQLVLITRYLKNKTEVEVEDLKVRVSRLESKVG